MYFYVGLINVWEILINVSSHPVLVHSKYITVQFEAVEMLCNASGNDEDTLWIPIILSVANVWYSGQEMMKIINHTSTLVLHTWNIDVHVFDGKLKHEVFTLAAHILTNWNNTEISLATALEWHAHSWSIPYWKNKKEYEANSTFT